MRAAVMALERGTRGQICEYIVEVEMTEHAGEIVVKGMSD